MNKTPSLSLPKLSGMILQFLHRYHVLIFVLTAIGGLSIATFLISQTINAPDDASSQATSETFDKETIEKVKALRKPTEAPAPLVLPSGRINPFI